MAVTEVPATRPRRGRVLRAVLLLVVLVAAIAALAGQWSEVGARAADLGPGWVALALVPTFASLAASFLAWRAVLAGLGTPLPLRPAARIFFVGQLGKYLPGSVWAVVAQMELGRAAGVRRDRMATAGLLVLLVSLTAALGLGLLALPALLGSGGGWYAALLLLLVPLAVLLHPRVLGPLLARAARLLRRPPPERSLSGRVVVTVTALSVLSNGLQGGQATLLALGVGAGGWRLLPLAVGGFALAAAAGFLAVPLPAGAVVREAVLVLVLAPVLDLAGATLVALVSRALLTAADLGVAGSAALFARRLPAAATEGSHSVAQSRSFGLPRTGHGSSRDETQKD